MTTPPGDTASVDAVLARMTTAEKIGQMTQVSNECISPELAAELGIGSILSGGNGNPSPNTPDAWKDMVGGFVDASRSSRLGIPILYGVDAVHGHSNVGGATVFPHNIGLGATGDADLVERIGRATAAEMRATGVRWAFAPTVAVPQDIRWGRTYEGFGRRPDLVASLGAAFIRGLQGAHGSPIDVLACAKHFVGDGGTTWGTAPHIDWTDWWDGWGDAWQIDQGDTRVSEEELRRIHLPPYRTAVDAGVMSVMASYNSWNGDKLHGHRPLLTGVLRGELGFRGFVVSDWMGVDQLAPDYEDAVVAAIGAGVDMVMVPEDHPRFIAAMTSAVGSGRISMERIDEAVTRILRTKAALGLFGAPAEPPPMSEVGSDDHRRLAAEAVRRSAVLLSNTGVLPLPGGTRVEVAGRAADDIGLQCGGWTVGWQGGIGATTKGTTLVDGLRSRLGELVSYRPDGDFEGPAAPIGVVCVAEPPYAEGPGDRAVPSVDDADRRVFDTVRERCEKVILVVYSGRPLLLGDLLDRSSAAVAAWLPGSEASALADVLLGTHPFTGATPQPWPRSAAGLDAPELDPLFGVGHGLTSPVGRTTP